MSQKDQGPYMVTLRVLWNIGSRTRIKAGNSLDDGHFDSLHDEEHKQTSHRAVCVCVFIVKACRKCHSGYDDLKNVLATAYFHFL